MRTFLLRGIAALVIAGSTIASLSCARDQQLTGITVLPQTVTVAGTPVIVYTALGSYIHPPETRDITSKVLWQTDAPSIISFSDPTHPNYLLPTGFGCGTNLGVLAFVYKNPSNPSSGRAVVGQGTVNVQCGNSTGADFGLSALPQSASVAPGSGATYTINVSTVPGNTVFLQVTGGLPSGASASLNPTSVTGSNSSTLTVTTSSSTPAGTYHLLITGSDSTSALTINVDLVVT